MTTTDLAAWVGALTGSSALIWDFYKWRTAGPKLTLTTNPNMTMLVGREVQPGKHILIRVANAGTSKTTLTTLAWEVYDSKWRAFRRKARQHFIVPTTIPPLPHSLDVGEQWVTTVPESPDLAKALGSGVVNCAVYHAVSKKPIRGRLRPLLPK